MDREFTTSENTNQWLLYEHSKFNLKYGVNIWSHSLFMWYEIIYSSIDIGARMGNHIS